MPPPRDCAVGLGFRRGRLYPNRKAAAIHYCRALGRPQPIHGVIVKSAIAQRDPSVPAHLARAFIEAARMAPNSSGAPSNIHAASYGLSAAEEAAAVGADFMPSGLGRQNRAAMERMLALCSSDGYIDRGTPFTVEEYFEGAMAGA